MILSHVALAASLAPYEPGLMLLAVAGILVAGVGIVRALLSLKLITRYEWILPVMIFLTGAVWLFLQVGRFVDVPNLSALVGFMLSFLIFLAVLIPVARLVLPSRALLTRSGVPVLLRGVAVVVFALMGMFVLLSWAFPNLNFTPVFVTSGVVSIVLGLALQDLLSNLMAGLVMSVERPFQIGDWIRIGSIEGQVVEQTWRTTLVCTREHDHVLVPNNLAAREIVSNYDKPTPEHLVRIPVGVAYETPCGVAIEALLDAAARAEGILRAPAPVVHLKDFQDSAILYELRIWIDNYGSLLAIESEVRKQIWYAFKRHGVSIPFPQRDVNLRQVVEPRLESACRLVITGGPLRGTMIALGAGPATIGRAGDNTIVIADQRVSSHHAVVEVEEGGGHRLRDLGSRDGTRLNNQLVESAHLVQGDEIRVGPVALVYETHSVPPSLHVARRVVPASPGRHSSDGDTKGTSGGQPAKPAA